MPQALNITSDYPVYYFELYNLFYIGPQQGERKRILTIRDNGNGNRLVTVSIQRELYFLLVCY